MSRAVVSSFFLFLSIGVVHGEQTQAQSSCEPPPAPPTSSGQSIFDERQEIQLGDIIAEHLGSHFRVIEHEVTDNLQRVGERVVRQLPATKLQFRFFLVDLPYADAFALPGGRIYVSRKLVATARSEDELAGVLAHECGHVITHQSAIRMTRALREVLKVTEVGDRQDILDKYNRLIEESSRRSVSRHGARKGLEEQVVADQVALYAVVKAGYSLRAYMDIFDRLAETHGKKGSWISNLFGITPPGSRRLREMIEIVSALPASCVERREPTAADDFGKWKAAVIAYSGLGRRETLHGVVLKKQFSPPLQTDISQLRFSPDGGYILAQDDASIHVLSREPLEPLFRIDAPDALPAHFTPDSKAVVLYFPSLRVESWSIEDEERSAAYELVLQGGVIQTELSPDGKTLACLKHDGALALMDVPSGKEIFLEKSFFTIRSSWELATRILVALLLNASLQPIKMGFSPDGKYFLAASGNATDAVDLAARQKISLPGSIRELLRGGFAFIGPDRLAGINDFDLAKSGLVRFPTGEIITRLPLVRQQLSAPAAGEYLILKPVGKHPVGAMDLQTKEIMIPGQSNVVDVHKGTYVVEERDGEIGLYSMESGSPRLDHARLPSSRLGRLKALALSPDLQWLAVSERSRGGVWNLARGSRDLFLHGFAGAYFTKNGILYADFPKFEQRERAVFALDPRSGRTSMGRKIDENGGSQFGPYLVTLKHERENLFGDGPGTLEVEEIWSGKRLWSREFSIRPPNYHVEPSSGLMFCVWDATGKAAKEIMKNDRRWSHPLPAEKDREGGYFVEVLGMEDGKELGKILVGGGKTAVRLSGVVAAGDWVAVADASERVLVYSLASGELKGRIFGQNPLISSDGKFLGVDDGRGGISVYELASLTKRDEYVFSNRLAGIQFTPDCKKLLVLTADQTAYLLDLSARAQ